MKRACGKRWIILLQCRYSVYFLMFSLTGYVYILFQQMLWTFPVKEFNVNFETNQSKRRTLFVYVEVDDKNGTFGKQTLNISKNRRTHAIPNNEERQVHEYNSSILLHKRPVRFSANQRTANLDRKAKRLPQVLIIGVKKCGTRALLEYLRLHPAIKAPGPEPHFFDRYFHLGLDWYRERMPLTTNNQITMEKTPRYFVSIDAPKRIWTMSNLTKLIVVVRNPVTRAISDFTQGASKRNYLYQSVFIRKAIRENGTGDVNTHWSIINTGIYIQHIQRWLKYFPLNQMFFVSGERLISNPAKELEGVQNFLGIKPVIGNTHFYFNATKGFPCVLKHSRRQSSRCFNSSKGRKHLNLDDVILDKLRNFYHPYNQEFYNLTRRNFGW